MRIDVVLVSNLLLVCYNRQVALPEIRWRVAAIGVCGYVVLPLTSGVAPILDWSIRVVRSVVPIRDGTNPASLVGLTVVVVPIRVLVDIGGCAASILAVDNAVT